MTVGNIVAAGASAPVLTTLVSVNPIYASFEADETSCCGRCSTEGGEHRGGNGNGDKRRHALRGRLQLVDNQVNTRSGTVRVRAVFDNKDGSLIPGPVRQDADGARQGRDRRCW